MCLLIIQSAAAIPQNKPGLSANALAIKQTIIDEWARYKNDLPKEEFGQLMDEMKSIGRDGVHQSVNESLAEKPEYNTLSSIDKESVLQQITDFMWAGDK